MIVVDYLHRLLAIIAEDIVDTFRLDNGQYVVDKQVTSLCTGGLNRVVVNARFGGRTIVQREELIRQFVGGDGYIHRRIRSEVTEVEDVIVGTTTGLSHVVAIDTRLVHREVLIRVGLTCTQRYVERIIYIVGAGQDQRYDRVATLLILDPYLVCTLVVIYALLGVACAAELSTLRSGQRIVDNKVYRNNTVTACFVSNRIRIIASLRQLLTEEFIYTTCAQIIGIIVRGSLIDIQLQSDDHTVAVEPVADGVIVRTCFRQILTGERIDVTLADGLGDVLDRQSRYIEREVDNTVTSGDRCQSVRVRTGLLQYLTVEVIALTCTDIRDDRSRYRLDDTECQLRDLHAMRTFSIYRITIDAGCAQLLITELIIATCADLSTLRYYRSCVASQNDGDNTIATRYCRYYGVVVGARQAVDLIIQLIK